MENTSNIKIRIAFTNVGKKLLKNQLTGIIAVLIFIILIAQIITKGNFISSYNITIIIRSMAFIGLVAIGQSLLLILGELDLSVGSIAGLSAVFSGILMVNFGLNPFLSFFLSVIFGAFLGFINGLIITSLNLNALIVTIGMAGIYKGINLVVTRGSAITGIPESILFIGQGKIFGLPFPFFILIIILIIISIIIQKTTLGRYIYAIGSSREAAIILGIKVKMIRIGTFMITGALASLAGMIMVSRLGSSQPAIGEIWVLPSIAAPVIGGVALTGGIGHPIGAIIGVAIIGIIENIIVLLGISPYWQTVVSGSVVVLAVSIDSISRLSLKRN